jgi:hypothetical protein
MGVSMQETADERYCSEEAGRTWRNEEQRTVHSQVAADVPAGRYTTPLTRWSTLRTC